MDENRPAPRLGTPEAAVQAAVNLIAKATGCAEGKLAYYLDMYYQLRVAYEDAKAEGLPQSAAPTASLECRAARQNVPSEKEPDGEDTEAAEELRAKRLRALEAARKAAATVDRKGEKNPMAMAAAEKRRIRERFMEARQKGDAPTAELLKACPTLTEGDVWRIVNGHNVGIEIYRLLESALDQIENSITKDDE